MSAAVNSAACAHDGQVTDYSNPPQVRTAKCRADVVPHPSHECAGSCFTESSTAIPRWKRAFDLFFVILTLPVTLPLMGLVALWVKLVSRGPALFRQQRIGLNGRPFVIQKFRSMRPDAPRGVHQRHFRNLVRTNSPMVKLDLLCDNRLIPGGCLLRASGLDELPQIFNVLRGEMSLVGPRPCLPDELRYFTGPQRERFQALPGLTGIWQVEGKGLSTFTEMNAMDVCYVRRASVRVDLGLILRTPGALLKQMGDAAG
ncbi:MAG: sugar transferase, partial [Verrucomicrobiae bacterium]|nr:sugar transferase [Verrucomicrobiae bacterium]